MTEDEITLSEAIQFASEMAADEVDSVDGEVPKHSGGLTVRRASNLQGTIDNIRMAQARENVEDPDEEQITNAIEQDVVDIILALGTVDYEYGIDLGEAFAERMSLIEDYKAFNEAVKDADSQEEIVEAVDEHMTEELEAMMGGQPGPMMGGGAIEPGDNVDAEDYDHEGEDRGIQ